MRTDGGLSPDNLSQSFSLRFAAAVCLSLAGELLLSLAQFAADHTQFQLEFSDLFMYDLSQGRGFP